MIESVLLLLTFLCLFLACLLVLQARFFFKRETALIDRLLKQAHVQPITIEREKIVKLPDAETPTETWIDHAFFVDDVKEELEQMYPEAARMSHADAQARYRHEWLRIQERLRAERAPLRAE